MRGFRVQIVVVLAFVQLCLVFSNSYPRRPQNYHQHDQNLPATEAPENPARYNEVRPSHHENSRSYYSSNAQNSRFGGEQSFRKGKQQLHFTVFY